MMQHFLFLLVTLTEAWVQPSLRPRVPSAVVQSAMPWAGLFASGAERGALEAAAGGDDAALLRAIEKLERTPPSLTLLDDPKTAAALDGRWRLLSTLAATARCGARKHLLINGIACGILGARGLSSRVALEPLARRHTSEQVGEDISMTARRGVVNASGLVLAAADDNVPIQEIDARAPRRRAFSSIARDLGRCWCARDLGRHTGCVRAHRQRAPPGGACVWQLLRASLGSILPRHQQRAEPRLRFVRFRPPDDDRRLTRTALSGMIGVSRRRRVRRARVLRRRRQGVLLQPLDLRPRAATQTRSHQRRKDRVCVALFRNKRILA